MLPRACSNCPPPHGTPLQSHRCPASSGSPLARAGHARLGTVAWGCGKAFLSQVAALGTDVAGHGPVTGRVWHWGDLDPPGLRIAEDASAADTAATVPQTPARHRALEGHGQSPDPGRRQSRLVNRAGGATGSAPTLNPRVRVQVPGGAPALTSRFCHIVTLASGCFRVVFAPRLLASPGIVDHGGRMPGEIPADGYTQRDTRREEGLGPAACRRQLSDGRRWLLLVSCCRLTGQESAHSERG